MQEREILNAIYENLHNGAYYGRMFPAKVRYPFFNRVLYMDGDYIGWHNAGSSANKDTIHDLDFIITTIFDMKPSEFIKKYDMRSKFLNYMDEVVYPENKEVV